MNKLYLDLCRVKALCLSEGVGKGTYRRCLIGRIAQATGVVVSGPCSLGEPNDRFEATIQALSNEVPGEMLLSWNDAENTTQADVLALIDRAATRASS